MTYPTQEEMHEEHTTWRSEHSSWLDDIARWRSQHAQALASLARLEADVREHGAVVLEHAAMIRNHQHQMRLHERGIGELQEVGAGEQYDPKTPTHEAWGVKHTEARAAHEEIKRKHRMFLLQLERLNTSLKEGQEGASS